MSELPACPKCNSEYTYEMGSLLVCPEFPEPTLTSPTLVGLADEDAHAIAPGLAHPHGTQIAPRLDPAAIQQAEVCWLAHNDPARCAARGLQRRARGGRRALRAAIPRAARW